MSDDFDFDDTFQIDDSFLRQVDEIAAEAALRPALPRPAPTVGSTSTPTSRSNVLDRFPVKQAGPSSKPWANDHNHTSAKRRLAPPSSDDFDDLPIPAESLAALDGASTSGPLRREPAIPSSRLGRTSSGNNGAFFQTHLNFRRDKQSTKGKRWDRTAFAESGRRVGASKGKGKAGGAGKGKGKGKGKGNWRDDEGDEDLEDEDEEGWEEDEMDWDGGIVPKAKPLVDPGAPYEPQRHLANPSTIDTYLYPTNRPKRDYQYEIVRACFTDNCLVALPTGLGKTFVAGVVMLNFYRWFPTGKIVFLAPTKPLVNQQIEACQMTCGIPSADAAVMTGSSVSAKERARLWDERRVFYCTPQTLDNDLKKGSVDPRDIVLAVFDEAHKASGSYAYTTILAYLTAHHPYFRVLALTATPGADVPRVQAVVDALHISRIEIREAEAPEIRKYMNEKRTERHTVLMGDMIESFRDRWAALMRPYIAKLVDKGILNDRDLDATRLRPFRLTATRMDIARDRSSGVKWAMGSLQALEKMARAMGHLLEFSLGMFHTLLIEISGNQTAQGKKAGAKGNANSMRNNFEFQKLLRDVEAEMNSIRIGRGGKTKADRHPKMQKTLELLLAHFTQAADDEVDHGIKNDTRAMVFCSFRDCVMEVVEMLNDHSPVLKATKFVGQTQGKQEGDKGFNQKEQKKTILEFKEGKYNILVATSIGEEGLDIGEVDFVVIYDMPKQSIKLLQRIGRTGRKRDGQVHVLMSENREDSNWDSAQQTHREIQEEILHSRNLELFEDVEVLLPGGKVPKCLEMEMAVDAWDPAEGTRRKTVAPAGGGTVAAKSKKGRVSTVNKADGEGGKMENGHGRRGHEVPEGGEGFRSVADLLRNKGKLGTKPKAIPKVRGKGRKTMTPNLSEEDPGDSEQEEEEEDDDDDDDAERAILFGDLSAFKAKKRKRDSEESMAQIKRAANAKGRAEFELHPPRLQSSVESAASGDIVRRSRTKKRPSGQKKVKEAEEQEQEDKWAAVNRSALDFFNIEGPVRHSGYMLGDDNESERIDMTRERPRQRGASPMITPPSSPPRISQSATHPIRSPITDESLVRAEDDEKGAETLVSPDGATNESGPAAVARIGTMGNVSTAEGAAEAGKLSPRTAAMAGFSQIAPVDLSWDGDDEFNNLRSPIEALASDHTRPSTGPASSALARLASPVGVASAASASATRRRVIGLARPKRLVTPTTPLLHQTTSAEAMPPPPAPIGPTTSSPARPPTPVWEATQFPVRRPGRAPRVLLSSAERSASASGAERRRLEESSPIVPAVRRKRLRRVEESSSPERERDGGEVIAPRRARLGSRRGKKRKVIDGRVGQFLDLDVGVSDPSEASSDEPSSSNDIEDESDLRFANDFQPTQAPRGYDQRAMYLAGLSTQIAPKHGLEFKKLVDREAWLAKARRPVQITDDEASDGDAEGEGRGRREESENEYELGSFVCDDDDDLGFATQSDPLSFR